jgi:PTH1 family peptidyl-tRNA hydrolase
MNLSGKCIAPLFQFYRCSPEDLIVIHDELDLPSMTLRLKTGGGTGGHNGLKSIDEHLGKDKNSYHRIRMGIGHPSRSEETNRMSPADYVLQSMRDEELKALDSMLDQVAEAIEEILKSDIQTAMNKFHRAR